MWFERHCFCKQPSVRRASKYSTNVTSRKGVKPKPEGCDRIHQRGERGYGILHLKNAGENPYFLSSKCDSSSNACTLIQTRYNNYFTEMCSGSEAGSYLRLMDFCITHHEVCEALFSRAAVGEARSKVVSVCLMI